MLEKDALIVSKRLLCVFDEKNENPYVIGSNILAFFLKLTVATTGHSLVEESLEQLQNLNGKYLIKSK